MQLPRSLPSAEGLGEDLSGLRTLFASSFPFQDTVAPALVVGLAADGLDSSETNNQDFDWSVTLGNINELTELAKSSDARIKAAEERAIHAEAKAKEAEFWLRRLHQAVLEGLSHRAPSI